MTCDNSDQWVRHAWFSSPKLHTLTMSMACTVSYVVIVFVEIEPWPYLDSLWVGVHVVACGSLKVWCCNDAHWPS